MSNRLSEKTVVITGAAQGIGRAIAETVLAEGAAALLVDVRDDVRAVAAACGGHAFVCDLTASGAADAIIAEVQRLWGRLDGLVNNAARVDEADLLQTTDELWHSTVALNLEAPFFLSGHDLVIDGARTVAT
jgi:NAD(P)-dependent dehydrogenase (short-subunit alcohol dehydrogenase family)